MATWYNFREIREYLAERDIAVVGSTYLDAWRKELDTSGYDALLDSIASTYASMYTNMTIPERIQLYIDSINKYKANGVLFHKNLSCNTFSLRVDEIAKELEQHFGPEFKTGVFEGCQGISGRFQKHAFEMGVNVHFYEKKHEVSSSFFTSGYILSGMQKPLSTLLHFFVGISQRTVTYGNGLTTHALYCV